MAKKNILLCSLLGVVLFFTLGTAHSGVAHQVPGPENPQDGQFEEESETIVPGPVSIKEKIALYVFISWVWLSIAVCIFFLWLKIKESDRLLALGFYSEDSD